MRDHLLTVCMFGTAHNATAAPPHTYLYQLPSPSFNSSYPCQWANKSALQPLDHGACLPACLVPWSSPVPGVCLTACRHHFWLAAPGPSAASRPHSAASRSGLRQRARSSCQSAHGFSVLAGHQSLSLAGRPFLFLSLPQDCLGCSLIPSPKCCGTAIDGSDCVLSQSLSQVSRSIKQLSLSHLFF